MVGNPVNFLFKISDKNFNEKVNATFILDDVEVFSKNFMPNINHEIELPISHAGANLLEIKINNHPDEITQKIIIRFLTLMAFMKSLELC